MKTRASIAKDARCLRSGSLSPRKLEGVRKPSKQKKEVGRSAKAIQQSSVTAKDSLQKHETQSSANVKESSPVLTTTCEQMVHEPGSFVADDQVEAMTCEGIREVDTKTGENEPDVTSPAADARATLDPAPQNEAGKICSGASALKMRVRTKLRITEKVLGVRSPSTKLNVSLGGTRGKTLPTKRMQTMTGQNIKHDQAPSATGGLPGSTCYNPGDHSDVQQAISDAHVSGTLPVEAGHSVHGYVKMLEDVKDVTTSSDHIEEQVSEPHCDVQNPSSPADETVACREKETVAEGPVEDALNCTEDTQIERETAVDVNPQDDKGCEVGCDTVESQLAQQQNTAAGGNKRLVDMEENQDVQPAPVEAELERGRRKKRPRTETSQKCDRSNASTSSDCSTSSHHSRESRRVLRKPGQMKEPRKRGRPVRQRVLTQTSLDSFMTKKANDDSSDSTAASWQAHSEDETSSSASLDIMPPAKSRRSLAAKRKLRPGMVQRRHVAAQCTTTKYTTIWFEFFEAEPKARNKMITRNHFTQTNARMIAELDYKKYERQSRDTRRYHCGAKKCTFKGMASEIIAHFKVKHAVYSVLICKRCKKRHESLAMFLCHLGDKSCSNWALKDEDEKEELESSSGGEDIVEVGSDDDAVSFASVNLRQDSTPQPRTMRFVTESFVSKLRNEQNLRHIGKQLADYAMYVRGAGEVLDQWTLSRCLFWSSPQLDVKFLITLRHGNGTMGVLRSHPHALYRMMAHLLDQDKRHALTSLLQHMHGQHGRLPKGAVKAFLSAASARSFAPTSKGVCGPCNEPTPLDASELNPECGMDVCVPSRATSPDVKVTKPDSMIRPQTSLTSTLALRKALGPRTTSEPVSPLSTSMPALCQAVIPHTSSAPALHQAPNKTLCVAPVAVIQSTQSCASAHPQKEPNRTPQPLVRVSTPSAVSVFTCNPNLLQHQGSEGKLPMLIPKISSPYTLSSVLHKLEGGKVQRTSKSGAVARHQWHMPAHISQQPNVHVSPFSNQVSAGILIKGPQTSVSLSPGYILQGPPSPASTGYVFSTSPLSLSTPDGSAATPSNSTGNVPAQSPNILLMTLNSGASPELRRCNTVQKKLPQIACAKSTGNSTVTLAKFQDVPGSQKVCETQSPTVVRTASPVSLSVLKYRNAFQSALGLAMKCSQSQVGQPEPKSFTPETRQREQNRDLPSTSKTGQLSNPLLCECGFQTFFKTALEGHIRAKHIGKGHSCRICSIRFPGLKQLENHFLTHVKGCPLERASTASSSSNSAGGESPAPVSRQSDKVTEEKEKEQPLNTSPSLLADVDQVQETKVVSCEQLGSTTESRYNASAPSKQPRDGSGEDKGLHTVAVIDISSDTSDDEAPEPTSRRSTSTKEKPVYATLRPGPVEPEALKPFFKCTIEACKFTATAVTGFAIHLASHPTSDLALLRCMYCGQKFDVINDMVSHMALKHGRRTYQCRWCMYRAAARPLIMLHLRFLHDGCQPLFYKCDPLDYASDPTPKRIKPEDYRCSVESCKFTTFGTRSFIQHYKTHHSEMIMFPCPNCDRQQQSVDSLIKHVTVHGLNTVQCAYCRHGTETFQEMLKHVCDDHADCELDFYIRTPEEQRKYKEFVADTSNRPIFLPEVLRQKADVTSELVKEKGSAKPCPFCEESVSSLSDIMQHCSDEHKIALPVSIILDMLLKKATAGVSEFLGCRFCSFKGTDSDSLITHIYEEFSYTPCSANDPQGSKSQKNGHDFEDWVKKFVEDSLKILKKLTKPYSCVQCEQSFPNVDDLRAHLYSHKKYFPYYCGVCAELFMTNHEATEHQRQQHKIESLFLVEEMRLTSVEQVVDEAIEVQIRAIEDQMRSSESEHCVWADCTYCCPERALLLTHMVNTHLAKHLTCSLCSFASYSKKVMEWHSNSHLSAISDYPQTPPPAEVVVETVTHSVPTPKPRGSYKCSYCKFRGDSSIAIREHAATAHRGLPVKLVVPPRPVNDALIPVPYHSADSHTRAARQTDGELPPSKTKLRAVCSSDIRAERTRTDPLPCNKCRFTAPCLRILKLHRHNMHPCDFDESEQSSSDREPSQNLLENPSTSTRGLHADDASVSSTTEEVPRKTVAKLHCKQKNVACHQESSHKRQSTAVSYKCPGCQEQFPTIGSRNQHLKIRHHFHALCDYCGKAFMNNKQAMNHCEKVHPSLPPKFSLITVDNSYSSTSEDVAVTGAALPSQEAVEGFSSYGQPVEPVNVDNMFVLASVPGLSVPMRFRASTFFTVHTRRLVVRIRDFTKLIHIP